MRFEVPPLADRVAHAHDELRRLSFPSRRRSTSCAVVLVDEAQRAVAEQLALAPAERAR